ncbi:GXWXG protein [Nocardioides sp. YR527]|nr:GXWXG protein [Nocardioides sp. YR527]
MVTLQTAVRFNELRAVEGLVDPAELDKVWAGLDTVAASAILGSWRGFAFSTGHPIEKTLATSSWHGKRFDALDDAKPLICRAEDGSLYSDLKSGRGEASLWNVEFRGEVTATMVYDGMPVLDHFKRVDGDTLMGIMNGKPSVVLDPAGRHFYFGLERA